MVGVASDDDAARAQPIATPPRPPVAAPQRERGVQEPAISARDEPSRRPKSDDQEAGESDPAGAGEHHRAAVASGGARRCGHSLTATAAKFAKSATSPTTKGVIERRIAPEASGSGGGGESRVPSGMRATAANSAVKHQPAAPLAVASGVISIIACVDHVAQAAARARCR